MSLLPWWSSGNQNHPKNTGETFYLYTASGAPKRLGEHLEKEDVPRLILGIIVLVLGALMLADGILGIT
jgi:hypothetical protein